MKRKFSSLDSNRVREINLLNIPEAIEKISQILALEGSYPSILTSGAFIHQLYDLVGNSTQVDQELHELRKQNLVKVISCRQINIDISYIVLNSAYDAGLSSFDDEATKIFSSLISSSEYCSSSSFLVSEILKWEYSDGNDVISGKLTHDDIDRLIDLGFLLRDSTNMDAVWLSYPSILLTTRQLVDGNQEILRYFRRKRYHEAYEREIFSRDSRKGKLQLRSSKLPIAYHIHDMVGNGTIRRIEIKGENSVNNLYRLP